jgi:hypothetical protein
MKEQGCLVFRRAWLGLVAAVVLTFVGGAPPVCAATDIIAGVRSTSPVLREVIEDGKWESPTFRDLVRSIGASDGIVYVEEGVCRHGVHACLLLDVTAASRYRILKILVDVNGVLAHRNRLDLIATIGHELRHAFEVLAEQSVRSAAALYLFYERIAPTKNQTFETRAAIVAGHQIREELGSHTVFVWQQVALDAH